MEDMCDICELIVSRCECLEYTEW